MDIDSNQNLNEVLDEPHQHYRHNHGEDEACDPSSDDESARPSKYFHFCPFAS